MFDSVGLILLFMYKLLDLDSVFDNCGLRLFTIWLNACCVVCLLFGC